MIIQLLPEQITTHWEIIKFGALSVNLLVSEQRTMVYCRNLLKNLLSGKYQCWLVLAPDRQIKAVAITRIFIDVGDIPHLVIDVAYGFTASTEQEKAEFAHHMRQFAESTGCETVIGYVTSEIAERAARQIGMEETFKVYSMRVAGG